PVSFSINLFVVALVARPPVVSAIGILVVIVVGWPEAVTGAKVAPSIVVAVFVAKTAGRFGLESSIVIVVSHLTIAPPKAFAIPAPIVGFAPAVIIPVRATSMLRVPSSLAITFAKRLPVILILIPLDGHHTLRGRPCGART